MAVQEWVVTSVEDTCDVSGRVPLWVITYQVPEDVMPGGRLVKYVPKIAIENRAVVYGLSSVDEALDVLLYESALSVHQADAAMGSPMLMDAVSARDMIREQIDTCREQWVNVSIAQEGTGSGRKARTLVASDVCQKIRDAVRIDPVVVAAARLEMSRELLREGNAS
ncbi:hypothetical protein ACQP1V_42770 (plasmid) [Microtetraspora malaysiensis]|uniref:hypothetical protein n=1 Tax=Microtetraspora malaysiensis TaxID=161358 RepID=UPI003D91FC00